jgi:RNA polymerase sigma-70 factor (ECF subfamily)
VEYSQAKRHILDALEQLPPRQRAAIVQRYYLEMSEKEMALALDAAPGTVKWLLNSARSTLRAVLNKERI